MSSALDALPRAAQAVVRRWLAIKNPSLLAVLEARAVPARTEREEVEDILSLEFSNHLRPDWEPTEEGCAIDDALGEFLLAGPIERQE